jgi:hypothetical protein
MILPDERKTRLDSDAFARNRDRFGPNDLSPYAGQWLAWSLDGSRIVAHHEDLQEVARRVLASGLESDEVVLECLPTADDFEGPL